MRINFLSTVSTVFYYLSLILPLSISVHVRPFPSSCIQYFFNSMLNVECWTFNSSTFLLSSAFSLSHSPTLLLFYPSTHLPLTQNPLAATSQKGTIPIMVTVHGFSSSPGLWLPFGVDHVSDFYGGWHSSPVGTNDNSPAIYRWVTSSSCIF